MAESQQDVDALKRRGRRRLVGAVALVLLAVIVLPMVFDSEPRNTVPPVSVRIPGEDDTPFAPKMAPKPAAKTPEAPKAESPAAETPKVEAAKTEAPKTEAPKPAPKAEAPKAKPKAADVEKPRIAGNSLPGKAPAPAERARAEAALAGAGGQYFVQVGAFANPQPVIAKLKEAKVPFFTEDVAVSGGKVTRVRAGPYASKEAAEKTLERLKGLGLKPGGVAAKAG